MWYRNQGGSVKPAAIDRDSSRKYVYIRKEFEQVTEEDPETGESRTYWRWMEAKIPKDAMVIYDEYGEALDDVYAALTELAEIIAGEE